MDEQNAAIIFGPQRRKNCLQKNCLRGLQTDQRLCHSCFGKYHIYTCYKRNFHFLANLCSVGDLFEYHFIGNLEDRFCRIGAHMHCVGLNI